MKSRELIIGSTALNYFYPECRKPHDLDLMSYTSRMERGFENYWFDESSELILELNKDDKYIDPNLLLTLKLSHLAYDINFSKHINDTLFLKDKEHKVNKDLYDKLVKFWIKSPSHGAKWAKLDGATSKSFFEDKVTRKFNHDSLHETVSHYERPLYERILKEPGKVACSEIKFNQLDYEDKIKLVKEEIYVTALERFIIPLDFKCSVGSSYMKSLKKLCTTMSGAGWFKFFLLDNYKNLIYDSDTAFLEKFKLAAANNQIKLNET